MFPISTSIVISCWPKLLARSSGNLPKHRRPRGLHRRSLENLPGKSRALRHNKKLRTKPATAPPEKPALKRPAAAADEVADAEQKKAKQTKVPTTEVESKPKENKKVLLQALSWCRCGLFAPDTPKQLHVSRLAGCHVFILFNNVPGPEIGLPGRISA